MRNRRYGFMKSINWRKKHEISSFFVIFVKQPAEKELEEEIERMVRVLRNGGVVVYPTDTVWGIGCDATNPEAVEKVFRLKNRKDSKSMLVLVDSRKELEKWVPEIPDAAVMLMEAAVRPLTIVYDHVDGIADSLRAEDGSTGVRVTSEPFSNRLCRRLGRPLVSTSANQSGDKTPLNFHEISEKILAGADHVADWRREEVLKGVPSNIIKVTGSGVVTVIR